MKTARPYIDFRLQLTRPTQDDSLCQVALLSTLEVGEAPAENFSISEGPYQQFSQAIHMKVLPLRTIVQVGKQLASWLLPEGTIRALFVEALKKADKQGGVRLRLIIEDHVLKQIPWEMIYFDPLDPNGEEDTITGFLALNPQISIVRQEVLPLPHPTQIEATGESTELQMVVATASPADMDKLVVETEVEYLKEALSRELSDNMSIKLRNVLADVTLSELEEMAQSREEIHLFHFAGHGSVEITENDVGEDIEAGFLYLLADKKSREGEPLVASAFADLLKAAGVWLVTLGACDSGVRTTKHPWHTVAGALLAKNIPAVVAMQYKIADADAVVFSQTFYRCLQSGLTLDEAMAWSRRKMAGSLVTELDNIANIEWCVPVLYSRLPEGTVVSPHTVDVQSQAAEIRQEIQNEVSKHLFRVSLNADSIHGRAVGIELGEVRSGSIDAEVDQNVNTVEKGGELIGIKIDKLG